MTVVARATACLYGLAIGDALGMPTQLMSMDRIVERYGLITGFLPADDDHPLAAGMPAGSITDDTEQALLLARHLVSHSGVVDHGAFARELNAWEDGMRSRGSADLLGPSTKRAVEALAAGVPLELAGRLGATNGAAMRIAPVGIAVGPLPLGALVARVAEACRLTHNTSVAIAGAAAVAAAVSWGLDGGSLSDAIDIGTRAAAEGRTHGHWVAAADVARRIELAVSLADPRVPERSLRDLAALIGTSLASQESVPTAFGILATFPDDPWRAVLAAASIGGDSDTIAAMVGAMAGACVGEFPEDAVRTVRAVNGLDLEPIAEALVALR